jgi:aralkylamine N-acetyltransferase
MSNPIAVGSDGYNIILHQKSFSRSGSGISLKTLFDLTDKLFDPILLKRQSDIHHKRFRCRRGFMKTSNINTVRCTFLRRPNERQIRQIMGLYQAQGWWQMGDDSRERLISRLIAGSHCFVIATDEKNIVGMGRAISDGISDAYIQDLTVLLDRRRQGIGDLILQTLLERLHSDGIAWIGLIAEPGSDALYRQAGFREMPSSIPMLMINKQ